MPSRSRIADYLQSYRFWLVDMVPSSTFPFFVLGSPVMGFQSITMPEVTLEVDEVKQINSMYKRYTYSGGSVGSMTLTRGARAYDDTFMLWVERAMRGNDMTPRNLLLIQYTNISINNDIGATVDMPVAIEAWEVAQFIPGRAWLLWDCIPTRYKAGTDLDAMTGDVSIMEIDLQPHAFTEFALLSVT
jgi:phage tail-like protein